jgi:hypothetical protein
VLGRLWVEGPAASLLTGRSPGRVFPCSAYFLIPGGGIMRTRTILTAAALLTVGALVGGRAKPARSQEQNPAAPLTQAHLAERTLHRRAVEAAVWGMPAVPGVG